MEGGGEREHTHTRTAHQREEEREKGGDEGKEGGGVSPPSKNSRIFKDSDSERLGKTRKDSERL